MSLSIGANLPAVQKMSAAATQVNPAVKEAWGDLTRSLRTDDLTGARQAYGALVKAAPEGASFQPGSPFAQLGKALLKGDLDAAKEAAGKVVRNVLERPQTPMPPVEGNPVPSDLQVASSTGGMAGSTLNVVA